MVGSQDYIKHAKKRVYSLYNKRIKELRKKKKKVLQTKKRMVRSCGESNIKTVVEEFVSSEYEISTVNNFSQ